MPRKRPLKPPAPDGGAPPGGGTGASRASESPPAPPAQATGGGQQLQNGDVWTRVLSYVGAGRYLQLATVCRSWQTLHQTLHPNTPTTSTTSTTALLREGSAPLLSWMRAQPGMPLTNSDALTRAAARAGALRALRHMHETLGITWHRHSIAAAAAAGGDVQTLAYVCREGAAFYNGNEYPAAAAGGHVTVLEWLHAHHAPRGDDGERTVLAATRGGHRAALEWALRHGFRAGGDAAVAAAARGDVEALRALAGAGAPLNARVADAAIARGDRGLDTVHWLFSNGVRHGWDVCESAARAGAPAVLRFLASRGCCLDAAVVNAAAQRGDVDMLRFLVQRGCPVLPNAAAAAAASGRVEAVQLLLDAGAALLPPFYAAAAGVGCVPLLEMAWARSVPLDAAAGAKAVAAVCEREPEGAPGALRWLRAHGVALGAPAALAAARAGAARVLRWLLEYDSAAAGMGERAEHACAMAASGAARHYLLRRRRDWFDRYYPPET